MGERRRKVFISYHKEDQDEVISFIQKFSDDKSIFIKRLLSMTDDIINSNDSKYVMSQIRRKFLQDSTVTLVMIGKCTWARRYVDWEIKSSTL
ncbi:TIR domain-containing protein [Peribacillus butanolivorans]|uniref:TIR domain-containing protein n=1 Tax=Peribacillus butanolivorans TaxID=421767 RepID=UPI0036DC5BF4